MVYRWELQLSKFASSVRSVPNYLGHVAVDNSTIDLQHLATRR